MLNVDRKVIKLARQRIWALSTVYIGGSKNGVVRSIVSIDDRIDFDDGDFTRVGCRFMPWILQPAIELAMKTTTDMGYTPSCFIRTEPRGIPAGYRPLHSNYGHFLKKFPGTPLINIGLLWTVQGIKWENKRYRNIWIRTVL